jgi:hypothetical protein
LFRSKWATGKAVRAGPAVEGAYLNRYVTDEQRGHRPIFIATLWAGASWLFFRVARSTRMTRIWALLPAVRLGPRLEKQPTDLRQNTSYFGDRTLAPSDALASTAIFAKGFANWLERMAAVVRTRQLDQRLERTREPPPLSYRKARATVRK